MRRPRMGYRKENPCGTGYVIMPPPLFFLGGGGGGGFLSLFALNDQGRGTDNQGLRTAMNTMMWTHPITAQHIAKLRDDWGVDGKTPGKGWFEVLVPGGSSTSFSSPPLPSPPPFPETSQ